MFKVGLIIEFILGYHKQAFLCMHMCLCKVNLQETHCRVCLHKGPEDYEAEMRERSFTLGSEFNCLVKV